MDHREKKYKAHRQFGDRRGGVISARTYFYADEAKCDHHMETFINCIKASGERNIIMNNYAVKIGFQSYKLEYGWQENTISFFLFHD